MLDSGQNGSHTFDTRIGVQHRQGRATIQCGNRRLQPVLSGILSLENLAYVLQDLLNARETVGFNHSEGPLGLADAPPVAI